MMLGIETSTAVCSVGLADESGCIKERSIIESHIHSEKLLTLTRELCEDQNISLTQLEGISVSMGPGSFTGLRIGLSTAKGLSFSLGKPLIAVPAFEAVSYVVFQSHPRYKRAALCVDAKQGEYYFSAYEKNENIIQEVVSVRIGSFPELCSILPSHAYVVTDRMDDLKNSLHQSGVIDNILPYCRGDVIAQLGLERLKHGVKNAPDDIEPMYLKDFIIRTHGK